MNAKGYLVPIVVDADGRSITRICVGGIMSEQNFLCKEDPNEGLILISKEDATAWFPVKCLTETRERFGAERILSFNNKLIQFVRHIDGRLVYLQRWLKPVSHEVDLYLMTDAGHDSYVTVNDSVENDDLARFKCMRVPPEMSAEEILAGIRSLIGK